MRTSRNPYRYETGHSVRREPYFLSLCRTVTLLALCCAVFILRRPETDLEVQLLDRNLPTSSNVKKVAIVLPITAWDESNAYDLAVCLHIAHAHRLNERANGVKVSVLILLADYDRQAPQLRQTIALLRECGPPPEIRSGGALAAITLDDMAGTQLASTIRENYQPPWYLHGCCGFAELMKLQSVAMTEFDLVLVTDVDTMLVRDIDDLLNMRESALLLLSCMYPGPMAEGGVFVVKPNREIYNEMTRLYLKGNFTLPAKSAMEQAENDPQDGLKALHDLVGGFGWGESGVGVGYGGETFQGFIAYFYAVYMPSKSDWHSSLATWKMAEPCMFFAGHAWTAGCSNELRTGKCPLDHVAHVHFTAGCGDAQPWHCNWRAVAKVQACSVLAAEWRRRCHDNAYCRRAWRLRCGPSTSPLDGTNAYSRQLNALKVLAAHPQRFTHAEKAIAALKEPLRNDAQSLLWPAFRFPVYSTGSTTRASSTV